MILPKLSKNNDNQRSDYSSDETVINIEKNRAEECHHPNDLKEEKQRLENCSKNRGKIILTASSFVTRPIFDRSFICQSKPFNATTIIAARQA